MKTRRQMREAKRLRSRRIRALLAGGLVLGVGAAATLAAWNDSEHATATFTSSTFGIVGSTNGTTFSDHNAAGVPPTNAAALVFSIPVGAMSPGATTYALFSVKTLPSSVKGSLQVNAGETPGGDGLAPYLTYRVRTIPTTTTPVTTCNESTFTSGSVVAGLGGAGAGAGVALSTRATETQTVAENGSAQVNYCFAITLPAGTANAAQGLIATQAWEIVGTSN